SPNYSVSANPTSVTISSSGQSATSTITVRATGGVCGTGNLSCSLSSLTAKMGCFVSPSSISLYAPPTTASPTPTITTTASSALPGYSASLRHRSKFVWLGEGCGVVLGCVGLLGFPSRQRRRRLGLSLLLFTLVVLASGCGGGSSGTPRGSYTITVT